MEIPKQFVPRDVEERIYALWEGEGHFRADPASGKPPFVIVIPPPNVTGALHTGHAMFVTLQDILIRWRRMQGYDALWLPGTDHAGIATQMVVAKELEKNGIRRQDLGREAFVEKIWQWRREKGDTILRQLRRLGASCDWSRTRFTLDPDLSRAVRKAFVDLYREGLIYRGEYMVNWCPRCGTALSDLEVEHAESRGKLWYIRYPAAGGGEGVVVATTRPETMLGDTAVAVHPDDERYRSLVGRKVVLPLMNREIPVVADTMVDRDFGTGAVKITPAHDPHDFEAGKRHGLPRVVVIGLDGKMTAEAGPFAGLDRYEARKAVLARLEEEGLLVQTSVHKNAVGHCQRCNAVVEPAVSTQWFLRIEPLAEPARRAVEEGRIRIIPDHWRKVYLNWMREIHDWCISRQLWWGHRIPAFSCKACGKAAGENDPERLLVSMEDLSACPYCGGAVEQDPDVLDTWFSSQLWPFSTLGWPEETEDFRRYYPTTVMETGYDILFFWVARMIMAGLKFTGEVPFRDVFLHGLVRDEKGRKMSKTLGNVVDPLELIETYGADAVRFTLAILCVPGTDVALDTKRMEGYRAFANKLWNAGRFVLLQCGDRVPERPRTEHLSRWDRWILAELDRTALEVNRALTDFKFYEAADLLYHFVWHRYCDWYVEVSKVGLGGPEERREATRFVLFSVLDGILRLLHPFLPFVTEALWEKMPGREGRLVAAAYPVPASAPPSDGSVERLMDLVTAVRTLRTEKNLPPGRPLALHVVPLDREAASLLDEEALGEVSALARVSPVQVGNDAPRGERWLPGVAGSFRFHLERPEEDGAAAAAETARLEAQLKKLREERDKFAAKLQNPAFVEKAPPEVVAKNRAILEDYERRAREVEALLRGRGA
ncbi:MAG: valine--tRNA ligase [Acidobacteriota bacterium]